MNHKNCEPESYTLKNQYFNSLANQWDEKVGNSEERIKILQEILKSKTSIKKGDTVLDIGCGTGVLIPLIHTLTGEEGSITAADPCSEMLKEAEKKNLHLSNINLVCSLIENMEEPKQKFDVVTAFAVFPHINDKKAALIKIKSMLKSKGKLYIFHLSKTERLNTFHSNLDAPVRNDRMLGRNEMETLFAETGFTMIKFIDMDDLNFIEAKTWE